MLETAAPSSVNDDTNRRILAVSEDQLSGFHPDPFGEIARRSGVDVDDVIERVRAMLVAGSIRRVRQTLLSTRLAAERARRLEAAAGPPGRCLRLHVHGRPVLRPRRPAQHGPRLPRRRLPAVDDVKGSPGFSLQSTASCLAQRVGAEAFRVMPARCLFVLGVGHTRRRDMAPGARSDEAPQVVDTAVLRLSDARWRVLAAMKRQFEPSEIQRDVWSPRAEEAGLPLETFVQEAERWTRWASSGASRPSSSTSSRCRTALASRATTACFTGPCRRAAKWTRGARSGGTTSSRTRTGARPGRSSATSTSWVCCTGSIRRRCSPQGRHRRPSQRGSASMSATPTSSGAAAARSSRPKIMPDDYVAWCAANGIDPASMKEGA